MERASYARNGNSTSKTKPRSFFYKPVQNIDTKIFPIQKKEVSQALENGKACVGGGGGFSASSALARLCERKGVPKRMFEAEKPPPPPTQAPASSPTELYSAASLDN
ncbi:MAG: hypothetical protein KF802_12870 [Bdellovibrionaceae bacterium]|nr:hypothetical protein [Pseudobdellovibrionaceae bacterium]